MAPLGGSSISDMNANYSSGFSYPGTFWNVNFPTVGTFYYACALHPFMLGMVNVVNDSSANSTANVTQLATNMIMGWQATLSVLETTNLLYTTVAPKVKLDTGITQYTVLAGFGNMAAVVPTAFNRFVPASLSIAPYDSVFFKLFSFEPHNVCFNGTGVTPFSFDDADISCGTNQTCFNPNYFGMMPADAAQPYVWNGTDFCGSGILSAQSNNFTVYFNKVGQYKYICSLHEDMGMMGTINVSLSVTTDTGTGTGFGSGSGTGTGTGSTNSTASSNSTSSGSTNSTKSATSGSGSGSGSGKSSTTGNAMSLICSVISLALMFLAF